MMPNYSVTFNDGISMAEHQGFRALLATTGSTPMAKVYVGTIGGAILQELDLRSRGVGTTSTVTMLAGTLIAAFRGQPLPIGSAIDVEANYHVICLDPDGTDLNPTPFLDNLAAALMA